MSEDKFKRHLIHGKDVKLNKPFIDKVLLEKGLKYSELHNELIKLYGLDVRYKSFMNILQNRVSWKLYYAWIIADYLKVSIYDLFELVQVDTEEKKKEIEQWNKKYGR